MTGQYTFVALARQDALTRAIQERLPTAAPKDDGPGTSDRRREHLARARKAKQEKGKVVAIDGKEAVA